MRYRLLWLIVFLAALVVAAELTARLAGFGNPPLYVDDGDPALEYRLRPGEYRWRGRRFAVNRWSMRSPDFPARKSDPRELRVLVIGDSIANGTTRVDQSELATTLLAPMLASSTGRPVVVGNASAVSWGPVNELAYVNRFGLFDADAVVIVVSSHDCSDVPSGRPVVDHLPGYARRPPWSAACEVARVILSRFSGGSADSAAPPPHTPENMARSLGALRELIGKAQAAGARVIVVKHDRAGERPGKYKPGHAEICDAAREAGATVVMLGPEVRAEGGGYVDGIHLNAKGQAVMARVIAGAVSREIR